MEKWLYLRIHSPVVMGNVITQSDVSWVIPVLRANYDDSVFYKREEDGTVSLNRNGIIRELLLHS